MTEPDRLRRAIETIITAGYQLDQEAFKFLTNVALTQDPTEVIGLAVKKLERLDEKPFFVNRDFLEQLLMEIEPTKELIVEAIEPQRKDPEEPREAHPTWEVTGKRSFHAYAKEVESNIRIIEDPTEKLNTSGTIEDFLEYFRDRLQRTEKILRQRMDVRSACKIIDAIKAPSNTKLKIIGMITEKRESKKHVILSVEDTTGHATVLVPRQASQELQTKARNLMFDQVVCLSIAKTRSLLFIAEDIIFPEIGQKLPHKAPIPIYAVLTSDMHVGSIQFQRDSFNRFILWLNGKYGNEKMREIASHVKYILIAGDIVDGIGIYPNQVKELAVKDLYKQYRLAAKFIEQIPDYVEVVIIPGNHDAPRKALPQPAISNDYLTTIKESRNVYSLGNPCYLSLHGVEVLMYHGRSLDDVISNVQGMSHNCPEKAMRLLLQSRHLAPFYGGKTTLSPELTDFLVMERVPDIFHAGHIHAIGQCNYRGVLVINSGGWQNQTDYMQRLGFTPNPGKVPLVNLQTLETTILPFN